MTGGKTTRDRWDEFVHPLSAEPRRQIIVSPMDRPDEGPASLPEVAHSPDCQVDVERLGMRLRQVHLPVLADAEYVQWTKEPFQVGRGDRFEESAAVMTVRWNGKDRLPAVPSTDCAGEPT
jgi:hypothetical protein